MTANELAEKLTDCLGKEERWEVRSLASNMLRQQDARIKELEAKYKQEFDYVENMLAK
jgi:uncharacterized protein (DUF305 family)